MPTWRYTQHLHQVVLTKLIEVLVIFYPFIALHAPCAQFISQTHLQSLISLALS